jgi:hypothetical protein
VAGEPRLRAVEPGAPGAAPERGVAPRDVGPRTDVGRAARLLGLALAIALVLLVWSRVQLGQRIDDLAGENSRLAQAVAERDAALAERTRLIEAHERRLGQVRERLREALRLADAPPLPEARTP